jgi:hypothetical protein
MTNRIEPAALNEDTYNRAFSVLRAASVVIEDEGVSGENMLPVFADFTAALALSIGGEETAQLTVERMLRLVEDWKSGKLRSELH